MAITISDYNSVSIAVLAVVSGLFLLNLDAWTSLARYNNVLEGLSLPLLPIAGGGMIPISVLDACGSIIMCVYYRNDMNMRRLRRSTLECFCACLIMQFGGTTLTSLILGTTPSWLLSHSALNAFILSWYLVFFAPFDFFYRLIDNTAVYSIPVISIGSAISCGHSITSWGVDKALFDTFHANSKRISESIWVPLFCGVLSSTGGSLLKDFLGVMYHPGFLRRGAPWLFEPTLGPQYLHTEKANLFNSLIKHSFFATVYYCSMDTQGYFWKLITAIPFSAYVLPAQAHPWSRDDACLLVVILSLSYYIYKYFMPATFKANHEDFCFKTFTSLCGFLNIKALVPLYFSTVPGEDGPYEDEFGNEFYDDGDDDEDEDGSEGEEE